MNNNKYYVLNEPTKSNEYILNNNYDISGLKHHIKTCIYDKNLYNSHLCICSKDVGNTLNIQFNKPINEDACILVKLKQPNIKLKEKTKFLVSNNLKEWFIYTDENEHTSFISTNHKYIIQQLKANSVPINFVNKQYKYILINYKDLNKIYILIKTEFKLINYNDYEMEKNTILFHKNYKKIIIKIINKKNEQIDSLGDIND